MGIIFMNSENSKISDPYRLLLKLSNKLEKKLNMLLYKMLGLTIHKNIKNL